MSKHEIYIGTKIIGPMSEAAWKQLGEGTHWHVVTDLSATIGAYLLETPGFTGSFSPKDIYAVGDRLTLEEMIRHLAHTPITITQEDYDKPPIILDV